MGPVPVDDLDVGRLWHGLTGSNDEICLGATPWGTEFRALAPSSINDSTIIERDVSNRDPDG
jgi:hypothetical protein